MKKLHTFSFHLHWITLCCFLLPFFYDSCSKKPEQVAEDSAAVVVPVQTISDKDDSISQESLLLDSANRIVIDTTTKQTKNKKDELLSETIIKKYPISRLILQPTTGTQTGLYIILDTVPFISLFAATIAFILLLIGLLAKLIDENALKIFLLLEIFAAAFLFITGPHLLFDYEILWGYWLTILCISILLILDAYILYKQKTQAA